MIIDDTFKPTLKCITSETSTSDFIRVSKKEYDKLKMDCELWYKMWLHECKSKQ